MNARFFAGVAVVALMAGLTGGPVRAQQAPAAPADQAAPAAPAHPTFYGVMVSGHVEAGTNINPDGPDNGVNFGQLFTDRANNFHMNQATLAAEQDIDSASPNMNFGWRVEGMYGTDARFTHTIGLLDRATHSPYQWDLVEASASAHLPVIFSGGVDLKGGLYPTPIGYEVIDAPGNFFYTHSYIFNFGIPLKHTGLYTVSHVTDMLDLWAGIDTGVNAGLPWLRGSDNNGAGAFLGGFAINNPIPNLTVLALAHVGPENGYVKGAPCTTGASFCYFNGAGRRVDPNSHSRQIYDAVTTYKLNDQITLVNELDFIRDDLGTATHSGATAEGTAFYGIYKWNDQFSFGARAEVFRDDQGFFVGAVQGSQAFVNFERGIGMGNTVGPVNANNGTYNAGKATYFELTLGANYTPPLTLPYNLGLTIRPEVRWDHAWGLNPGFHPFDVTKASAAGGVMNGTKDDQVLISVDAIFGF
jgi:hypothetical protein